MLNEEERNNINYRFSGYQLEKITLDETGPSYYVVKPHPYYYGQPDYWKDAPGNLDTYGPGQGGLYPLNGN